MNIDKEKILDEKIHLITDPNPRGRWMLAWILPEKEAWPSDAEAYEAVMESLLHTEGVGPDPYSGISWRDKGQAEAAMVTAREAYRRHMEKAS